LKRASIIVVGEKGANITRMKQQLNKKIKFST
jgi:ribosomal protein S3